MRRRAEGGEPAHPAWYLNLLADPNVHVRVMADVYAATAQVLTPSERAEVRPRIVAGYPMFAGCQQRTERELMDRTWGRSLVQAFHGRRPGAGRHLRP